MFVIRNVFHAKPGKAKELVTKFKAAERYMEREGIVKSRIMTDVVAGFWTVVSEFEVPNLDNWEKMGTSNVSPEIRDAMKDYMTLVEGGHREIFKIE
jgi:hypothetical protein